MIDIEIDIYDAVHGMLEAASYTGSMSSEFVPVVSTFPSVSLVEMGQYPDTRRQTQSGTECFAVLSYEAQVYALNKNECRATAAAVDNAMIALGFTPDGSGMQFIRNLEDPTIFRMVGRYTAETDGRNIFRRA